MWVECITFFLQCGPQLFVPPITVETESRIWAYGVDQPVFDYRRTVKTGIRADGAVAQFIKMTKTLGAHKTQDEYRAFGIPEWHGPRRWAPNAGVPPVPEALRTSDRNEACRDVAKYYVAGLKQTRTDRIVGYATIRYRGKLAGATEIDADIAFAPQLGCAILEAVMWQTYSDRPGGTWSVERVTSLRLGKPDPALFSSER